MCIRDSPIISGTGKATNFKFGRYIERLCVNNKPIKNFRKSSHMRSQGILHFSGHPHIGRIARLSLRQHGFLVFSLALAEFATNYYSLHVYRIVENRTAHDNCGAINDDRHTKQPVIRSTQKHLRKSHKFIHKLIY